MAQTVYPQKKVYSLPTSGRLSSRGSTDVQRVAGASITRNPILSEGQPLSNHSHIGLRSIRVWDDREKLSDIEQMAKIIERGLGSEDHPIYFNGYIIGQSSYQTVLPNLATTNRSRRMSTRKAKDRREGSPALRR
jgi:hypothetical protein